MIGNQTFAATLLGAVIIVFAPAAGAQDVCVPLGTASTADGRVGSDTSWNGATRIDLDNPGICPTTYLRLRRTESPDAALYLGLVVNTAAVMPNTADRIVIGFSPLEDTPSVAWRIHISPFGAGVSPGMGMPSAVKYWRNGAPGWNSTPGTDPNDVPPLNDWLKPSKMRLYYYGGNRWDFEWKIPLAATPDKMTGDAGLYLPPAGSRFRFYFNLLKVCDSGFVCQYPWPLNRPLTTSLETGTPDISFWGLGSLDQRVECGVLLTWDRIGLQIPPSDTDHQLMCYSPESGFVDCSGILPGDNWPTLQGPPNTFYAYPVNRMATGANVQAQFSVAPWGAPAPGDWTLVQYPAAAMPPVDPIANPPSPATVISPLAQGTITLCWPLTYQQSCLTHADPFRSIQVLLSKPATDTFTTFPTNPVERSMDTVSASEFRRSALIGTKGYPAPASGPIRMILTVDKDVRKRGTPPPVVPASALRPAGAAAALVAAPTRTLSDTQLYREAADVAAGRTPAEVEETLTWVCRSFMKTGTKLKIEDGGGTLEFENTTKGSAFGYICGHRGSVERWDSSFTGSGLATLMDGVFELDIPPGSAGRVETRIEAEEFRRWQADVRIGYASPFGKFGDAVDGGWSETIDLEYRVSSRVAFGAQFGMNEFRRGQGGSDVSIFQNSLETTISILEGDLRPYVQAGVGFYVASPGDDAFGLNFGVGARYRLSDLVGLEAGAQYHEVINSGPNARYGTLQVGVSLRF